MKIHREPETLNVANTYTFSDFQFTTQQKSWHKLYRFMGAHGQEISFGQQHYGMSIGFEVH